MMEIYSICSICGGGLDVFGRCPVCTETGEYRDPREPKEIDKELDLLTETAKGSVASSYLVIGESPEEVVNTEQNQ